MAWSIAAALVIECKYFETDIIMELFLGNGVVCTFVARWVKVAEVPTLNKGLFIIYWEYGTGVSGYGTRTFFNASEYGTQRFFVFLWYGT